MKRLVQPAQRSLVFSLVVFSLSMVGCTPAQQNGDDSSSGKGGSSSGSGGARAGSGGSSGSGGSNGSSTGSGGSAATGSGGQSGGSGGSTGAGGSTPSGSGGQSGGSGGATGSPDAGQSPADMGNPSAGSVADKVGKVAKTLFKATITRYDGDGRSGCGIPANIANQRNEDTLKLDAAKNYDVTFRVRGLVEPRMYQGGMPDAMNPFINIGGTPHKGGAENQGQYSNFRVDIAEPMQSFHLNRFQSGTHTDHQVYPMDYRLKAKVKGGAKMSVIVEDSNGCAIANKANKVVEGVPADVVMQPFKDQFLLVEVESVVEAP